MKVFLPALLFSLVAISPLGSDFARVAHAAEPIEAASCILTESEVVDLTSSTEGKLSEVFTQVGERVAKGQLLALLEQDLEALRRDIAKVRAERDVEIRIRARELEAALSELETQQKLLKRKVVAQKVVNEAQTAVDLAKLQLERAEHDQELAAIELQQAEAALKRRSIISPLDGVVTKQHKQAGEYIDAANPVLTIAAINPLLVETYLPIAVYPRIKQGQKATISPQEPIGGRYQTKVKTIAPVIDAASGLFRVDLDLVNPGGAIPAGIRCSIGFGN